MKRFEIFKAGRHTAASGATLSFSEDDLRKAVEAYDPAIHEAPIVVGHPKDNGPAYGWIKSLSFNEGSVEAEPIQVDEQFSEMVQAGRFKKRSASFYTPDSPNNPKPGAYYLRHVGFLGAQPPAIKGLKDVSFSDAEEGVVEFADTNFVASLVARLSRGLRDWIIADKGVEEADKVIPDYLVTELEAESRRPVEVSPTPAVLPSFSEPQGDPSMTPEEIKALQDENAALKAKQTKIETDAANFSEREKSLAEREKAIARTEIGGKIDALVQAGKALPAQREAMVNFAMVLDDGAATIDFKEGDKVEQLTQRAAYLKQLEALPKAVDFKERSGDDGKGGNELTNEQVVDKARAYVDKAASEGRAVSFTEAVAAVNEGKA